MPLPRQTMDRLYANVVTGFHFFWSFIVLGGMIFLFIYPPYALIQIIIMSVTLLSNLPFRNNCPLTLLEERLRQKIDPSYHNDNSFATTYFNKIFRTHVRVRTVSIVIAIGYVVTYLVAVLDLVH